MRKSTKKYRLDEMLYIDQILDALCNKYPKSMSAILEGENQKHTLKGRYVSQKFIKFLETEGIKASVVIDYGYTRKTKVAGINVEVEAIRKHTKDYKAEGLIVTITYEGVTKKDLEDEIAIKEKKFLNYLTSKDVPTSRICVEPQLECEYKFEKIACKIAN